MSLNSTLSSKKRRQTRESQLQTKDNIKKLSKTEQTENFNDNAKDLGMDESVILYTSALTKTSGSKTYQINSCFSNLDGEASSQKHTVAYNPKYSKEAANPEATFIPKKRPLAWKLFSNATFPKYESFKDYEVLFFQDSYSKEEWIGCTLVRLSENTNHLCVIEFKPYQIRI